MSTSLPSRLLLVAIASLGLYQGCKAPGTEVNQTANAQVQETPAAETEATSETQQPAGETAPSILDALEAGVEIDPEAAEEATGEAADEVDEEATGETEPAVAACDLSAHLNQADDVEAIAPQTYGIIDEQEAPQYQAAGNDVFRAGSLPSHDIDFDEQAMLTVLQNTKTYFAEQGCQDPKILQDGILGTQGVSVEDAIATLDFMIATLTADIEAGQPTRLKNTDFINQNFDVVRWLAYDPGYLNETRTRITKYAVFTHSGSRERTETYDTPVYKVKDGLEDEEFITRYTKQEALSGVFEPGGAEYGNVETLAYLTREGFEDALLQGTAFINFPDGSTTYFNVDKNNGIAYVPGLAQPYQERFWYFKEVNKLKGYGHSSEAKIQIEPGVTFAGDVLNIGLGKIVAIEDRNQNIRLGIIADTGGAFLPNLHQLDFFAGVFPDRTTYQQAVQELPEYTQAYFLVKKQAE
ncbi:MAG: hypothetical protein AAFN12_10575 [Cyanobacteria bacterium J06560_2]